MSKVLGLIAKYMKQGHKAQDIMNHIPKKYHRKIQKQLQSLSQANAPTRVPSKVGKVEAEVRNVAEAKKLQEALPAAKGDIALGDKVSKGMGKIHHRGVAPAKEALSQAPKQSASTPEDWEQMLLDYAKKKKAID